MRDVSSWFKITIISLCCFLASCKSPDVEVTAINKKLPAPSLKAGTASPFDQDMDAQTYVRVQGTCDNRVGNLSISFDNSFWAPPPSMPDTTASTLTPGTMNDSNCADGVFDFYLTKADVLAIWGIQSGNTNSVENIYIKGETLIGETFALVLHDNNSGSKTPTNVTVEKINPVGFGGSGKCEEFYVTVRSDNGNINSYSQDITFGLSVTVDGITTQDIPLYEDATNCASSISSATTFTVARGNISKRVFYRMPTDTASIGKTFNFKVIHPTALTANSTPASVVLRDSAGASHYMQIMSSNYRLYKNTCSQFNLSMYRYDKTFASDHSQDVVTNLASNNSYVKFYSDVSCSTSLTSLTLGTSMYSQGFYVRYEPLGTQSTEIAGFNITALASSPAVTSYLIDPLSTPWSVDVSSKNTNTMVDIDGPQFRAGLPTDQCLMLNMTLVNSNHTPIPTGTTSINLAFKNTSDGAFYSDYNCLSPVSVTSASSSANAPALGYVYLKLSPATAATTYQMMFTVGGVTTTTEAFPLVKAASMLRILGPNPLPTGQCTALQLTLTDSANNVYGASNTMSILIQDNGATQTNVYSDSSCTVQNSLTTLYSASSTMTFYYKPGGYSVGANVGIAPSVISGGPVSYPLKSMSYNTSVGP